MGYFKAMTCSSFKTTADGRMLFFPWGTFGRGYRVASEQRFLRLRRQVEGYLMGAVLVPALAAPWLDAWMVLGAAAALTAGYSLWAVAQCRTLIRTTERIGYGESVAAQARAHNPVMLWAMAVVAVLLTASGAVVLAVSPEEWFVGVAAIVLFGACTLLFARMLQLRHAAGRGVRA